MAAERIEGFPDVPSLGELGVAYSIGAWRGLAAPAGVPEEIATKLAAAIAEAAASSEYTDFMSGRGFGVRYLAPADHASFMADADGQMASAMAAAGLAKS